MSPNPQAPITDDEAESLNCLLGLAIFGEQVAAKTYRLMGSLRPEYATLLRKFAGMEAQHSAWFREVASKNGLTPDKRFADQELGYLRDQVDDHFAAGDFEALAVLQGFIVECLAIATYDAFLPIADRYAGLSDILATTLADERYHVEWVTRYLRLRFFDATDEFTELVERVNVQGIDCVGGTMMNIADYLDVVGISGSDCAASMMDEYATLLHNVGVEERTATRSVMRLFHPLVQKYRVSHSEAAAS